MLKESREILRRNFKGISELLREKLLNVQLKFTQLLTIQEA